MCGVVEVLIHQHDGRLTRQLHHVLGEGRDLFARRAAHVLNRRGVEHAAGGHLLEAAPVH